MSDVLAETTDKTAFKIASFPFPPLLHASTTGEFSGTMGETVKLMCEKAQINCTFKITPLKRAQLELTNGTADALITINIGKYHDCCIPSKWASPWSAGFFVRNDYPLSPTRPEQLLNQSFIVVQGMRSPYTFMPDLKQWEEEKKTKVSHAANIAAATKMFNVGRAPLLWGSDDFNWYFEKQGSTIKKSFIPLITTPVVVWVRKDKEDILNRLNVALDELQQDGLLDDKMLLKPGLMKTRYKDAPFD